MNKIDDARTGSTSEFNSINVFVRMCNVHVWKNAFYGNKYYINIYEKTMS